MTIKKKLLFAGVSVIAALVLFVLVSIFFDQAVLTRGGTTYHEPITDKVVALTFDDGPSPQWTPRILVELDHAGVKATFFMLGEHVDRFPAIARMVAEKGHEIGNHTYDHALLPFNNKNDIARELNECARAIRQATGKETVLFRPPKAWLTPAEKAEIKRLGYRTVLWSLNSKDWVTFDDKFIIRFLVNHVRPGDIILFHDSGGVFGVEGGDRHETVQTIVPLVRKLRAKGYRFVTVSELVKLGEAQGGAK